MSEIPTLHADSLKVLRLVGIIHALNRLAEPPPRAGDLFLVGRVFHFSSAPLCQHGAEADMENERLVNLWEVALLVEVRRIGDDPPPSLRAMNVVEVVNPA